MNFMRAIMGSTGLSISYAIQLAGLWVGSISMVLVGLVTVTCMHMLLECGRELSAREETAYMSYADVAEYTCKSSSNPRIRSCSNASR